MLILKEEQATEAKSLDLMPSLVFTNKRGISSAYGGTQAKRLYISQKQKAKLFEVFSFP